MTDKISALVDQLGQLTMQQAADMGKMMEEKWGININNIQTAPELQGVPPVDESTTATVILKGFAPGKKIPIIKAVRPMLDLGLLEAKTFVEDLPKVVKSDIEKDEAEKLKKILEEAGGEVEVK
jgi:large subunit ribosomal protein L7/L12